MDDINRQQELLSGSVDCGKEGCEEPAGGEKLSRETEAKSSTRRLEYILKLMKPCSKIVELKRLIT